jgi:gamma-glutamyl:cysteine ligase YbdK (ATP-grasp superfamily)
MSDIKTLRTAYLKAHEDERDERDAWSELRADRDSTNGYLVKIMDGTAAYVRAWVKRIAAELEKQT